MSMRVDKNQIADLSEIRERPSFRRVYQEPVLGVGGWIVAACITLVIALFIRAFVFQSYKIPSESMLPTLEVGDHILVNKFLYGIYFPWSHKPVLGLRSPERGDVVVFYPLGRVSENEHDHPEHLIKRIVGVPGDMVQVIDFTAYVNGKPVDLPSEVITSHDQETNELHRGRYGPVKLQEDEYFMMGDNRINSSDSRYFGPIHRRQIEGRAFLIYWSWRGAHFPWHVCWERIGLRL